MIALIVMLIGLIVFLPANFSVDGCLDFSDLSICGKVKFLLPFSFELILGKKKKKGNFRIKREKISWALKRVRIQRVYTHFVCSLDSYFSPIPALYTVMSNVLMQAVKENKAVFIHSQEITKEKYSKIYFCSDFNLSVGNFILILFSLLTNNSKKEQKEGLWKKEKTQS